ncbi:ankyrin repeat domain-containing protein [Paenibacillus sp. MWE-103]|uniref:Ankyrin repeat domain-containing protein n=1 Tax=Paenibacillus artemisiicola TaxID=1172618 RepID=A0ABS3W7R7_9BACL|nr:ankyrin repeat domain-containing protein [Paenibacillus artemisiicola]MBO7744342.1 ankyrin repeat domain-containing protein [Paenibacillus artemisiicola]
MEIDAREPKDRLIEGIRKRDTGAVRSILAQRPELLHASLPGVDGGAALSLAAQGNDLDMVKMLMPYGPRDVQQALSRASMRAHREAAEYLVEQGADPNGLYSDTAIDYGPVILAACEALNPDGIRLMIDLGADPDVRHRTSQGRLHSPLGFILGAYARNPRHKHACLEVLFNAGVPLEDTPLMAFHRGRIDLLEEHVRCDPDLVRRRFQSEDIYRPESGFDMAMALTPIEGTTLLHLALEYDEFDIANWLLDHGADINARAAVDTDGYGGHTPLFHAVAAVLSPTDIRTRFLLDRGADPEVRATIRHPKGGWDELTDRVFENVTALEYALLFKDGPSWCNRDSISVLANLG